jgi:hypothetical protein
MSEKVHIYPVSKPGEASEIILREGKAAEIYTPTPVDFTGTFKAVIAYWQFREALNHPVNACHLKYSYDALSVELVMGERDKFKDVIKGKIIRNPELVEFGINNQKYFTVDEFAKFIRLRQHLFADRSQYQALYANLNRTTVKIATELENEKTDRGNKKSNFNREVTSDLPERFSMLTNPLKGYRAVTFDVEIGLEAMEGGVKLWLISPQLIEIEKAIINEAFEEVLDAVGSIPLMEY